MLFFHYFCIVKSVKRDSNNKSGWGAAGGINYTESCHVNYI